MNLAGRFLVHAIGSRTSISTPLSLSDEDEDELDDEELLESVRNLVFDLDFVLVLVSVVVRTFLPPVSS
jgi:hypothetical protein